MHRLASYALPFGLAAVIAAAFFSWLASGPAIFDSARELTRLGRLSEREYRAERRARERAADESGAPARAPGTGTAPSPERRAEEPLARAKQAVADALATARALGAGLLGVVSLGALCLVPARLSARARRRCARYRIIPGRTDAASPQEVRSLIESVQQQQLERWWRRLVVGQPSSTFEISGVVARDGGIEVQLALVCPTQERWRSALEAGLRARYRDARIVAGGPVPPTAVILRLKKRYSLERALRTPEGERYEDSLVDALAATLQAAEEPATVQYVLTPAPALFDRLARSAFRAEERELERARLREQGDPGSRSEVTQLELRGGAEGVQHRALFFTEVRIGAHSLGTARHLAGVVRGHSRA